MISSRWSARLAVLASILAIVASPSRVHGAGLNLSWDDCGSHGVQIRSFACDTNIGANIIVGSFVAPAGVTSMSANEVVMELQSAAPAMPDWWLLRTGLCRANSLVANFDFTGGPFNCFDYWQAGAIGAFAEDPPIGNWTRIKGVFALPAGDPRIGPVAEGTEVYSYKAVIRNAKTTGLGACGGCEAGACIVLDQIRINQPAPAPFILIANPADRHYVSWQCPALPFPGGGCNLVGCPTPTRTQTWGRIKQLYR